MTDLSREAKSILAAAAGGDEPTGADKQRVYEGVMGKVGAGSAGAAGAAGGGGAATAGSSGVVLKVIAGAVLAGAIGVGAYVGLSSGAGGGEDEDPVEAKEMPVVSVNDEGDRARDEAPEVTEEVDIEPEIEMPAVELEPAKKRAEKKPSIETLLAEKKLIAGARRALARGDGAGALDRLKQHATKFPKGQLRAERQGTRVLALCELGRTGDASVAAKRFLKRYGKHPMAARVRASCAE